MYEFRLFFNLMICTLVSLHLSMQGVVRGQAQALGQMEQTRFQTLSEEETIEVLRMLSVQIRSNSGRVLTWEGEVEFVLDRYHRGAQATSVLEQKKFYKSKEAGTPHTVRRTKSGTIKFILDTSKKSHYEKVTCKEPVRYFDSNDSELGSESGPYEVISIVTPESYIRSLAIMPEGRTTGHSTKRESVTSNRMSKRGIFDPQAHLKLGMPIWEYFDRMRKLYEKSRRPQIGSHGIEVQRRVRNGKTEYKIQSPYMQGPPSDGNNLAGYMKLCFSDDAGFNLVSMELTSVEGIVLQQVKFNYAKLGEVLVPQEKYRCNYTKDGKIWYEAKYLFKNQKINHVLEPGTFTYENLELLDGDILVDEILNKKYRYKAATQTLEPVEK